MKTAIKFLFCLLVSLSSLALADTSTRVKTLVTVTNLPSHGDTFVFNGSTRTWVTNTSVSSTQISIGGTVGASATNLYLAIAGNAFTGQYNLVQTNVGAIFVGNPGFAITASKTGTWGAISSSSSTSYTGTAATLPFDTFSLGPTNEATQIINGLNSFATNKISEALLPTSTATITNAASSTHLDALISSRVLTYSVSALSPLFNLGQNNGAALTNGNATTFFSSGTVPMARLNSAIVTNISSTTLVITGQGTSVLGIESAGSGFDTNANYVVHGTWRHEDKTYFPGGIYDNSDVLVYNTTSRQYYDADGIVSGDHNGRILRGPDGEPSVRWGTRFLDDSSSSHALDWENRRGYGSDGSTITFNWTLHKLYDNTGTESGDWNSRLLKDSGEINSINWNSRTFINQDGDTVGNWQSGIFTDGSQDSINWLVRRLYDDGGNESVGYRTRELKDNSEALSQNWNTRKLYDSFESETLDYNAKTLTGGWTIDGFSPTINVTNITTTVPFLTVTGTGGNVYNFATNSTKIPAGNLDSTVVINTRSISAGLGLTGGGDLSANRTIAIDPAIVLTNGMNITVGTVNGLTTTTFLTNSVIGTVPWLAISIANNTATLNTNSTKIPAGNLPSTIVYNTRAINTTSPITGGGDLSADRTLAFDGTATFVASGATTLNASALASGTVPTARIATEFPTNLTSTTLTVTGQGTRIWNIETPIVNAQTVTNITGDANFVFSGTGTKIYTLVPNYTVVVTNGSSATLSGLTVNGNSTFGVNSSSTETHNGATTSYPNGNLVNNGVQYIPSSTSGTFTNGASTNLFTAAVIVNDGLTASNFTARSYNGITSWNSGTNNTAIFNVNEGAGLGQLKAQFLADTNTIAGINPLLNVVHTNGSQRLWVQITCAYGANSGTFLWTSTAKSPKGRFFTPTAGVTNAIIGWVQPFATWVPSNYVGTVTAVTGEGDNEQH